MTDDMKPSDSNILARIDERTQAQTVSFALHIKDDADTKRETNEKFDKMFSFVGKSFDKMGERFDKMDIKIDTLWDGDNRRKGAFGASKILTGGIWAGIVLAASYFMPKH